MKLLLRLSAPALVALLAVTAVWAQDAAAPTDDAESPAATADEQPADDAEEGSENTSAAEEESADDGAAEEAAEGEETPADEPASEEAPSDAPAEEEATEDAPADDETPAEDAPADEPGDDPAEEGAPADEPSDDNLPPDEPADAPAADETVTDEPTIDEPAAEEAPAEDIHEVKVILSGLNNPCGIAVQPETGHLFMSDSGAGRILSFDPAGGEKVKQVVIGFPQDEYGKGPIYQIGPLGLAFWDKNTLVVGGGELKDSEELVRAYDLSTGELPLKMEDMKQSFGPIPKGDDSESGEGNFYGVATTRTGTYITSNGDDTKGWVLKIELNDGAPGELKPFIPTKVATGVDAPVGIAMNRDGQVVVGQMGEITVEGDSLLTIYDPQTGELLAQSKTGLHDIAGLAFSPTSGKLYVVDFAWIDPSQGGLYRLDIEEDTVHTVKIATLDKPTALAFTPDGTLYVTLFGTAEEGSTKKPGKLVKILGEL